jgi:hypothetical protein
MLVFVEGFPGSGKSTTAQWLARQWQRTDRACRWLHEHQPDHPVVGIPAGARYETWEEYFEYRRDRWPDNGLLWKGDNVFDAEAWPFEVVFESAAGGGGPGTLAVRGAPAGK